MESHRVQNLSRKLLQSLRLTDSPDREGWLFPMLEGITRACDAALVFLGESGSGTCLRSTFSDGNLVRQKNRRLVGVSRRVVTRQESRLENQIRKGSLFRTGLDGWPGLEPVGYAAVPVPGASSSGAWITALRTSDSPDFTAETLGLLELAAEGMSTALENEERWRALEKLSLTDDLTHIPNYRYLRAALATEMDRSSRYGQTFTVVMVDVDHLKQYNAVHGHLAGSELLQKLAAILREEIRHSDVVAKYGGDEFLLILPRTEPAGGMVLSERVRDRIETRLRGRGGEVVSCSFGVAGFPVDGRDFVSLMSSADRALFRAKQGGRNQVIGGTEAMELTLTPSPSGAKVLQQPQRRQTDRKKPKRAA